MKHAHPIATSDVTASAESTIYLLHIFGHKKSFYHSKPIGLRLSAVANKTINILLILVLKLLLHKLSVQLFQVAQYLDMKLMYRYFCRSIS